MGKIDLNNTLQGKLFSLAEGKGSLFIYYTGSEGAFPGPDYIKPKPFPDKPFNPFEHPEVPLLQVITHQNAAAGLQWNIIMLPGGNVMLTNGEFSNRRVLVMAVAIVRKILPVVILEETVVPENTANLQSRYQFKLEYIENSPLCFYLKTADGRFVCANAGGMGYLGTHVNGLGLCTAEQVEEPAVNDSCIWFIDTEMLRANKSARSFDTLSRLTNRKINEAYINKIMGM